MPCCLALAALSVPRLTILVLAFFSDWVGDAYQSNLTPFLGFLFLPLTTLAYALAIHASESVQGIYLVLVVIAVLMDLGLIAGHARGWSKRKESTS